MPVIAADVVTSQENASSTTPPISAIDELARTAETPNQCSECGRTIVPGAFGCWACGAAHKQVTPEVNVSIAQEPNASERGDFSDGLPSTPPFSSIIDSYADISPLQKNGGGSRRIAASIAAAGLVAVLGGFAYIIYRPRPTVPVTQTSTTITQQSPSLSQVPSSMPAQDSRNSAGQNEKPEPDASPREVSVPSKPPDSAQSQKQANDDEARRQQEQEAQRQQELASQRQAMQELLAKQQEQQKQIEDARQKLADEQARREQEEQTLRGQLARATSPSPVAPPAAGPAQLYRGPSSGEIVWSGNIKGTELITIEHGQASSGVVTGMLPGVPVLLQPTDTK